MALKSGRLVFTATRGRDGSSVSTINTPDGFAVEAVNVELDGTAFAVKRNGATQITEDNAYPGTSKNTFWVYIPDGTPSSAEIWMADVSGTTLRRLIASTRTWSSPTLVDNLEAIGTGKGVAFNGKFFVPYKGASGDYLYVWDGSTVRRVGRQAGTAPTVANTGAGSYAATQRWYQQSERIKSGSTVVAEGERSSSVSFTPSGGGTAARITKGTTQTSTTHWVIWASSVGSTGPFYELAETAVGTTTYDDSTSPSSYSSGTAAQVAGTFTQPTSARYLLNDGGNRLLMAGAFRTGATSRVSFTPVLGSLGRGDDERIPDTDDAQYWIDLDEEDGGLITGLGGPLNGQPIVFKERQIWRLVPTGDADAPYEPRCISKAVGCIDHRTIAMGHDETGNPCLYFCSTEGPYRLGASGLQYLGRDIEDQWANRSSSNLLGVFYPYRRQYWLAFAVDDYVRFRFSVRLGRPDETGAVRGGWVRDLGTSVIRTPRAMEMLAHSPGLSGTGSDIPVPHVLYTDSITYEIVRCDSTASQDDGANYQGYVDTRPEMPGGIGTLVTTGPPLVIGTTTSGTPTITITQYADFAASSRDATCTVSTTRAAVKAETGGGISAATAVAFRIGDGSALNTKWTLDAVVVPWESAGSAVTL